VTEKHPHLARWAAAASPAQIQPHGKQKSGEPKQARARRIGSEAAGDLHRGDQIGCAPWWSGAGGCCWPSDRGRGAGFLPCEVAAPLMPWGSRGGGGGGTGGEAGWGVGRSLLYADAAFCCSGLSTRACCLPLSTLVLGVFISGLWLIGVSFSEM
jgi:hypothetical protein